MDTLTTYVSAGLRSAYKTYLTAKARLRGKAFFCNALAGNSEINLCVNSDLTVSCSCHDVDGSGHIGDLGRQSLAEILAGRTAARFREMLAQGRLPTPLCSRCCDLRTVAKGHAQSLVDRYHPPRFVMVENTSACNLRCVSCPRKRIRKLRRKVSMSLEDVRKVAGDLAEAGVREIAYLNQGEPFLSKNILEELQTIRELNPGICINTSTNGQLIDTDAKREAALLIDVMQISLDGISQAMVAEYQRGLDFEKVYRNMKALVAYRDAKGLDRPTIIWKYLLFRWNERKRYLRRAIEMARDAGVDKILFEKTASPLYGVPLRSYVHLGEELGEGVYRGRCLTLREAGRPTACCSG
ncbi:MAG: hypothetical protein A2V70_18435 [Planctomycetes bacterium RBG_13_63_9]|nr:MAG: hypothetical protein A2V70_18435 [Planctomycetes bacterium RBG_13_63_9]